MEPKLKKKPLKFDIGKQHIFEDDFESNFRCFGIQKSSQNRAFVRVFIENADLAKMIVFPEQNYYFSSLELPKID